MYAEWGSVSEIMPLEVIQEHVVHIIWFERGRTVLQRGAHMAVIRERVYHHLPETSVASRWAVLVVS